MTHARPNDRPVHPECAGDPCICDKLWQHWDGLPASLADRIDVARTLERRARPGSTGDLDEEITALDEEVLGQGSWELSRFLDQLPGPCIQRDPDDPELKESLDRLREHIASRGYWDDD